MFDASFQTCIFSLRDHLVHTNSALIGHGSVHSGSDCGKGFLTTQGPNNGDLTREIVCGQGLQDTRKEMVSQALLIEGQSLLRVVFHQGLHFTGHIGMKDSTVKETK